MKCTAICSYNDVIVLIVLKSKATIWIATHYMCNHTMIAAVIIILIAFQYNKIVKWTEDIWTEDFWSTDDVVCTSTIAKLAS